MMTYNVFFVTKRGVNALIEVRATNFRKAYIVAEKVLNSQHSGWHDITQIVLVGDLPARSNG